MPLTGRRTFSSAAPSDPHALAPGTSLGPGGGLVDEGDPLEWAGSSFLHAPEGLDPLLTVRDLIVQPLDLLSEDADPLPHLLDQLETPLHHRPRDEGPFISRVPGVPEEVDRPPVPLPAKPCPHHGLLKDLQQHMTSGRVEHSGKLLEQVIECQQEDQRSDRLYRLRQEAEVLR
jgi:hypothetical protein